MFMRYVYTNTPFIYRICTVYQPYIYRNLQRDSYLSFANNIRFICNIAKKLLPLRAIINNDRL